MPYVNAILRMPEKGGGRSRAKKPDDVLSQLRAAPLAEFDREEGKFSNVQDHAMSCAVFRD